MKSILTLTLNPAIDESTDVENVIPEHKLRCTAPVHHPGGGGINVSRAIHKLGGTSKAVYLAGGATGQMLGEMLDGESLTHEPFWVDGLTRTSLTVFEKTTTLQYRFNMPGAEVCEAERERLLSMLRALDPAPDFLVASGSLPPGLPVDFYAQIGHVAREIGAKYVLDTNGSPLRAALEAGVVYLCKPNVRELSLMVENDNVEMRVNLVATALVNDGMAELVLVSLGAAGAFLSTQESCERIAAPVVPIASKVGAGDSTVGGMVLALARGEPVARAARFGVAAGAAAVMTPGTLLCRRDDTERLFAQMMEEHFSAQ